MLSIENIRVGELEAIDLEIADGQCVGIMGESGCGKSRLLRAIADMDAASEGEVCVEDACMSQTPAHEWRRQVCLLPAESQWWFDTVGQHFDTTRQDLKSLGFGQDAMQWHVSRCSSGEKQRLAILRMLANRPRVLLLDEPTANLDADNTRKAEQLLVDYLQHARAAAIWVSHDRAQLARVAGEHCYDLSSGRLQSIANDSGTAHA